MTTAQKIVSNYNSLEQRLRISERLGQRVTGYARLRTKNAKPVECWGFLFADGSTWIGHEFGAERAGNVLEFVYVTH